MASGAGGAASWPGVCYAVRVSAIVPAMPEAAGPSDAIELSSVRRALVVKLRHHGDVLLASPVFTALRGAAPHLEIDALVYADTSEMLEGHPAMSQLHVVERRWKDWGALQRIAAERRLFAALRARRYDLLLHLSGHPRGAWLARSLGCRYSVAPDTADRSRFWRKSFTHLYPLPQAGRRHAVELNLDALRRIGVHPAEEDRKLILVPGEKAEREVSALLAAHGLSDRGYVHWHPTSRWLFKCWPAERVARVIDQLQRRGTRVVVTAAPAERELAQIAAIRSHCAAPPVDFSGKLTLKMIASLAARARLFVGVDSAPMHIAAAMGTPVVAMFGPSGEDEWGPWRVPNRVVTSDKFPCRPCGNDGCGGGKVSECLTTLREQAVLEAIDALL